MINTIYFDFGDVFINLDKQATVNSLRNLGLRMA
jgi:putative hydrolase of the HAD superfamily